HQNRSPFFVLSVYASEGLSTISAGSHIIDDVNRRVLAAQLHCEASAMSHLALHLNSPNSRSKRSFFRPDRVPSFEWQSLCQLIGDDPIASQIVEGEGTKGRRKANRLRSFRLLWWY